MRHAILISATALLAACPAPGPGDGGAAGGSSGGGAVGGGEAGGSTGGGTVGGGTAGGGTAGQGTGGGTSGGAGGGGSDAGSEVYTSTDGRAFLLVPLGAAPADAGIRVTTAQNDAGTITVTLEPSGLQFTRPALLAVKSAGWQTRGDAGLIATVPASLGPTADGGVERVRSVQVAGGALSGPAPGFTLVPVTHFSQVILGQQNGPFPWVEAELDVGGGAAPSFNRSVGTDWLGSVTFVHVDPTGFVPMVMGTFRLSTAGSVALVSPSDGAEKALIGTVAAPATFAFGLRCVAPGPGAVVLTVSSAALEQQVVFAASGLCEGPLLAEVLVPSMTAPPLPGGTETAAAVTSAAVQAVTATAAAPAPNASVELSQKEATYLSQWLGSTLDPRPELTSALQLMCERCPLMTPLRGVRRTSNVSLVQWTVHPLDFKPDPPVRLSGEWRREPINPGQTFDFGFSYECEFAGTSALRLGVEGNFVRSGQYWTTYAPTLTPIGRHRVPIECIEGLQGDAMMLSDNTRLTRNGSAWAAMAPGVTANVIHAHADLEPKFHPLAPGGLVYGGVTNFRSNGGLSPLTLRSGRQTATATFNGTRYVLTGLVAGAAFNATDSFTIEHQPASGPPITLAVSAPPPLPADPNLVFGAPLGFDTRITLPDGTFDTLYVFLLLRAPGAAPPPGEFGVMLLRSASSLSLMNGNRVANLVDGPALEPLRALGWSVQTAYVAAFNTQTTSAFFPGLRPLPVQAGRMFQFTGTDLGL